MEASNVTSRAAIFLSTPMTAPSGLFIDRSISRPRIAPSITATAATINRARLAAAMSLSLSSFASAAALTQ